jgi:hypothetical protein
MARHRFSCRGDARFFNARNGATTEDDDDDDDDDVGVDDDTAAVAATAADSCTISAVTSAGIENTLSWSRGW